MNQYTLAAENRYISPTETIELSPYNFIVDIVSRAMGVSKGVLDLINLKNRDNKPELIGGTGPDKNELRMREINSNEMTHLTTVGANMTKSMGPSQQPYVYDRTEPSLAARRETEKAAGGIRQV
jgi:hypothetical protein